MVEDRNAQLAREHGQKAEDYAQQAGQHTASAASTVGHDIRAAGEQIVEAGKYVGARLTAPIAGEDDKRPSDKAREAVDKAKVHAQGKADEAADATKSTYAKIKDSIGGFFGGKTEHKDDVDRTVEGIEHKAAQYTDRAIGSAAMAIDSVAEAAHDLVHGQQHGREEGRASDATHKAADAVNKGVDKAHEGQRSVYESMPSQGEVKEQGQEALESAKDTAVQAKDAVVGGLSYIGGRLTAPVSGEEETDRELADKAKAKTRSAADAISDSTRTAKDKTVEATEETKEKSKGLFSSIRDAFSQPAEKTAATEDRDTATLHDKAKGAISDVQDKVRGSVEDTRKQLEDAAIAAEPKTATEAVLAEGGIPSNTADLLAQRQAAEKADQALHEGTQGEHISTDSLLSKTAEAWGGDHLTGDGKLTSVRNAADQAGPHSRMN